MIEKKERGFSSTLLRLKYGQKHINITRINAFRYTNPHPMKQNGFILIYC